MTNKSHSNKIEKNKITLNCYLGMNIYLHIVDLSLAQDKRYNSKNSTKRGVEEEVVNGDEAEP